MEGVVFPKISILGTVRPAAGAILLLLANRGLVGGTEVVNEFCLILVAKVLAGEAVFRSIESAPPNKGAGYWRNSGIGVSES